MMNEHTAQNQRALRTFARQLQRAPATSATTTTKHQQQQRSQPQPQPQKNRPSVVLHEGMNAPHPSPSVAAPAPGVPFDSLALLQIDTVPSLSAPLRSIASPYRINKLRLIASLQQALPQAAAAAQGQAQAQSPMQQAQLRMLLAMAMLETQSFDPKDRDSSKDNQGDSMNFSAWNINRDMLMRDGMIPASELASLNTWAGLDLMSQLMVHMIEGYGLNSFLNYAWRIHRMERWSQLWL